MGIATVNPATGETLKTFTALTDTEIEEKLAVADRTFREYRKTSFTERSQWLRQTADIVEQEAETFGKIITEEMGKPLAQAIAEVKKCASVCHYYADNAKTFLAPTPTKTDASESFVTYHPLGAILAVMPWNFPFWQVFRFAAPALMAGNVGLLKHASNVPQCAIALEDIFRRGGFPDGALQTLLIGADKVAQIVADDRVKAATLTGSEPAGASLAAIAGKHIKKTVLELGGSDPFIVLESADLEEAVKTAVTARMLNNGQSCIAAKRFILVGAIADPFEKALLEAYKTLTVGDPTDPNTDIGPLATASILRELDGLVRTCVSQGAQVLIGGEPLDRAGNFYPPTLLANIPPGTPADTEEFFGPVGLIFRVNTLDEAIELANSTPLGLGASAWTNNLEEGARLIRDIDTGAVFINGMTKSDPRLPFGGIKRSGYGRELSVEGIREFVNLKTVWIK